MPESDLRKIVITGVLILGLMLGFSACSKLKDAANNMESGQAFLDSRIPAGLSPQYYPPQGFVWGGFRSGNLPQARYGVASPPTNPKAQILIISDADYPAEVYFELSQQYIDDGFGVWLLEAPGQGGAGRYFLQDDSVSTPDYRDAQNVTRNFITDIIKPTPDKPLFVIGTGYSGLTTLSLTASLKIDAVRGFIAYDPYLGGPISTGENWHSDTRQSGYWGGIAQSWQMSNPDLRLLKKSEGWKKQMQQAYKDLNDRRLPVTSLKTGASVLLLAPKNISTSAASLCVRLPHCSVQLSDGPETLAAETLSFIETQTRTKP